MNDKMFFMIIGRLTTAGINANKKGLVDAIYKVRNLSLKHHRQTENACNGEGVVRGKFYRLDSPEGYVSPDVSVFDVEIERIEKQIISILAPYKGIKASFQHDPRGATVRLKHGERDFSDVLWI